MSLTSHLNSAADGFDSEFCKALRAYAGCTQRTSKACRGNLVYHSAVLGISDLMSQRNCSKDGPTSSTNPEVTHDPCNYHSHAGAREHRGGDQNPPNYLFCGLFGDPHLRTFKDHFQTCKVEGAWPLIDNNYLSVQVTNVPVVPGSSATATNKASVLFFSFFFSSVTFRCLILQMTVETWFNRPRLKGISVGQLGPQGGWRIKWKLLGKKKFLTGILVGLSLNRQWYEK